MKNRRKGFLILGLIVAVTILGIGYAATTVTLKVEGTAKALPNNSFDVYFTAATADTATATASSTASVSSDTKVATMAVSLTNVDDTQTATFTVKNDSEAGISAKFDAGDVLICQHGTFSAGTCTAYSSDYFDVTTDLTNLSSNLAAGNTTTFTVTATLKKVNAGTIDENQDGTPDDIVETFDVVLKDIEPVQE